VLKVDRSAAVALPHDIVVDAGSSRWAGVLPADGRIRFDPPTLATSITVRVRTSTLRNTTSSVNLKTRLLPVGISEIGVDTGAPIASLPERAPVVLGCDSGLALGVDGVAHPLQVTASRADVLAGVPVEATPCDALPVDLAAGTHRVSLPATRRTLPVSITLSRNGDSLNVAAPSAGSAEVRTWGSTERSVRVDAVAPALLIVRENANSGWRATIGGHRLAPARVDGWQQAFVVPAGTHGVVSLSYGPQRPFAIGLIIGLLCVAGVLALAFVRRGKSFAAPVGAARHRVTVRLAVLAVAVALLTGAYGIGVLAVAALVLAALGWWERGLPVWIGAALLVIAAVLEARADIFHVFVQANSPGSQLLCVAAVVSCAIGAGVRAPRHGRDP
jgi:arabinofuranan 3-O-arabinosyltransferase